MIILCDFCTQLSSIYAVYFAHFVKPGVFLLADYFKIWLYNSCRLFKVFLGINSQLNLKKLDDKLYRRLKITNMAL